MVNLGICPYENEQAALHAHFFSVSFLFQYTICSKFTTLKDLTNCYQEKQNKSNLMKRKRSFVQPEFSQTMEAHAKPNNYKNSPPMKWDKIDTSFDANFLRKMKVVQGFKIVTRTTITHLKKFNEQITWLKSMETRPQ